MTPNYLEFHTIKSDEPKLLPPVKIQRNTKITKKKKKKKTWQMCLEGERTSRGRTSLEHPLQGTCDRSQIQHNTYQNPSLFLSRNFASIWNCKGPRIAKTIMKNKIMLEDSYFPILTHRMGEYIKIKI